ncbi:MAG: hypothetical protein ACE5I1_03240 [bacterium]
MGKTIALFLPPCARDRAKDGVRGQGVGNPGDAAEEEAIEDERIVGRDKLYLRLITHCTQLLPRAPL